MQSVKYDSDNRSSSSSSFERRIGTRVATSGFVVSWVEWAGDVPEGSKPREWPVRVDNVSVTGAALLGPSALPIRPDAKAVIRYRGRDSGVVVCRTEPGVNDDELRFGVEFAVLSAPLRDQIYALLPTGSAGSS